MNVQDVTAAIGLISSVFPPALAAYNVLRGIWMSVNPGQPESAYLAFLQTASQTNIDQSAAILLADGFVEVTPGNWVKKPAVPPMPGVPVVTDPSKP